MSRAVVMSALVMMLALNTLCLAQPSRIIAEKLYDQVNQSYANHNLDQVLSFVDPASYININAQGNRITFSAFRQDVQQFLSSTRNIQTDTEVKDVDAQAGRMVVYFREETRYEKYFEKTGWVPVIDNDSAEETWAQIGGHWKLVLTHVLRYQSKIDPQWLAHRYQQTEDQIASMHAFQCALAGGCR
jgi:hypothetical protein